MLTPYIPESLTRFADPHEETAMRAALEKVKSELGRKYPLVIGGEKFMLDHTFNSINPARPAEVIGIFSEADAIHGDMAVADAARAFETWKYVPVEERARYAVQALVRLIEIVARNVGMI